MSGETAPGGAARQMGMAAGAGPFGSALIHAAERRPEIVGVSADLSKYTDMHAFAARFPERFVNVGMAEQNLVSVAAGLARAGCTVVATTFSAFATRRPQDFTVMQVALARADVKLIGAVPGILASFGPSHTGIDDIAIMRSVPGMVILDPCDAFEAGRALEAALEYRGPVYLRQPFFRPDASPVVADAEPFGIGAARTLRTGRDLGILASGHLVEAALEAAAQLAAAGIQAELLQVSTLKPFDDVRVAALARRFGRLVTAENHSVVGGLYSAVCETLGRHGIGARVVPVGVPDVFPPFGTPGFVAAQLGMDAAGIVAAAHQVLA
ncbi:MAG: transketolase family protein [Gammaproteobacteria bacterium]